MNTQSHKMNVSIDEPPSHLSQLQEFYRKLDEEGVTLEKLPRERRERYQLEALNLTLSHIWNNNEYYREALQAAGFESPVIASLAEFGKVPLLRKDVIRGDKSKLLCVNPRQIGQVHLTSGTSGKPIYTSYTLGDQYVYDLLPKYLELFPETDDDVVAIALPYEFALPGLGFQRLFQFAFGSAILSLGKGGYMAPVDKSLALMKEYEATVLATTPSYAALLAEECEKFGYQPGVDFKLRRIILTGEGCSYTFRKRLEQWWGCEASFFYGSTECGVVGIECKEHAGYHVAEGHVYMEIVDPDTGARLGYGQTGEIVMTTLLREGMPMMRYRSGDIGYMQRSTCACGITMDVLQLRGRMENMIRLGGNDYSPFLLEQFLLEVREIGLWYRFIVEQGKLTIEVEPHRTTLGDDKLARKVQRHMEDAIGETCEVVVRHDIPRTFGKATRVIIR
ncbi:phenylacetate--CoA ligase family protein [Cohnella sp. GCM10027633]|uniref:phenylacetate--CoA ligase family protein n=1 Tax=unclassified Cohnella TaxID=2636738 RepID=UPI0036425A34